MIILKMIIDALLLLDSEEEVMSHQPSANEDYFEEMNDYENGTMNV